MTALAIGILFLLLAFTGYLPDWLPRGVAWLGLPGEPK